MLLKTLFLALSLSLSTHAIATTLTFNDVAPGGIGNSYEANGFVLTASPQYNSPFLIPQFYAFDQTSPNGSVSLGLAYWQVGAEIELHAANNELFDAMSIDISRADSNSGIVPVTFAGIKANGKAVYASYWLSAKPLPSNETFTFGDAFRDIKSLRWSQGAEFHKFDNVALSNTVAVPEPSSIALMSSVLAGLAFLRRRKK